MTFGSGKTVLIAMLALVLSVGHAACACLTSTTSDHHGASAALAAMSMTMNDDGAHSDHEHHGGDHENHSPCDGDTADCAHCQTASVAASSLNLPVWGGTANAPHPETTPIAAFAIPPPFVTALKKTPYHRWRAPPRIDPVSQKIRLLI